MASDANQNIVTEVICELNKVIRESRKAPVAKDSFLRFISYLEQLRPILDQLNCGKVPQLPLRVQTALSGIKIELLKFQGPLQTCKSKSGLYLLTHCQEVVNEIQNSAHGVGNCLGRFSVSKNALQMREAQLIHVGKKVEDLAREMQQAQFTVSSNEERIRLALSREAESKSTSDSQSAAILVDIGRELGLDLDRNRGALFEQLQLFRRELVDCRDHAQIQLLETIEGMFQSWTQEPAGVPHWHSIAAESADDDPLTPFDSFLCPLTKQIMKDPVFVQSGRTYERSAIENWLSSCQEEGRQAACPVSGQILTSTELHPSLVLCQTIQEWKQRNVGIRIRLASTRLGPTTSSKETEHALEDIVFMADDSAENRRKLLEAGFIPLVLAVWQRNQKSRAHQLRTGSVAALRSMAIGSQENKHVMVEMGAIKLAVQSLGSKVEKEQERAVALLHEFSLSPAFCTSIGSDTIVALVSATSTPNPEVCKLAEQTLGNLEGVDANALQMAKAGRMQPVLTRLCQGPEATQVELAQNLAEMILTNTSKEAVAETGGKTLVRMLSISPNAREAALGALLNLSTLDGTADALVKAGAIAQVVFTIFSLPAPINLKETAICTLANLVLVPGSWEDSVVDKDGHFLHSEKVLHKFFGILQSGSALWKEKILQVLYSMACSNQVAGIVAANISSCGGSTTLVTFVTHADTNTRLTTMRLLSLLSVYIGDDIAAAIRSALHLKYLKEMLQLHRRAMLEEHVAAATILANTPLTEFEVIRVLDVEMLHWTVTTLQDHKTGQQRGRLSGRTEFLPIQEALLGILLHFARNSNLTILNTLRASHVFTIFQETLTADCTPLTKERSALGLQHLSQRSHLFHSPHLPRRTFFGGLCVFPSSKSSQGTRTECAVHGGSCSPNGTFCLVAAGAVAPLIRLVKKEDDDGVREAAVGALSTLLVDNVDGKRGVEEIVRVEGVQPMFELLYSIRKGQLQEKAVWVIERVLRVEECAERFAADQGYAKGWRKRFVTGGRTLASSHRKPSQCSLRIATRVGLEQCAHPGGKNSTPHNLDVETHTTIAIPIAIATAACSPPSATRFLNNEHIPAEKNSTPRS